jgi:hypothetical protein
MAGWTAAAIVGGAVIGAGASRQASKAQERAAAQSTEAQERMFNRQVELQEPFRQAGVNALPELVEASRYTPFGMEQFQQDPGYAFRMREGLKALDRTAAARGGLLSGAQLRGVTRFGQELGSQEFTNAFNRYQAERAARLNPLQTIAGMGQSTAATIAGQAGQLGQNIGANLIGAGNARASGYMGMANAVTGGLGQYLNYTQGQDMLKAYRDVNTLAAQNAMLTSGRKYSGAGMPAGVPQVGDFS